MMRVGMSFLCALVFCAGGAGVAVAHVPEGVLYPVFLFPDSLLPTMDGDLSDWEIVPDRYWTGTRDLMETVRGLGTDFDEEDLAVRTVVGWSDTYNRLYFAVEAYDDIVNVEREGRRGVHGGDIWEIVVDADHSGGIYNGFSSTDTELENRWRSAHAQNYHTFLPPESKERTMWLWGEAQWACTPPYGDLGWRHDGSPMGKGTVYQEMWLTPFDDLNWVGIDSSRVHDLEEGEILGISWSFLDYDADDGKYDGFWNLSHMTRMDHTADLLPDFVLEPMEPLPTPVEEGEAPGGSSRFGLDQNYPNPFNATTRMVYEVAERGPVHLSVYAPNGQRVRTLVDGDRLPDRYSVAWDGKDDAGREATSGLYLCRMEAGRYSAVRKMLLVR